MNIYLVARTDHIGYAEFDAFVCVAETEEDAKKIHPYGVDRWDSDSWVPFSDRANLAVVFIGIAAANQTEGIILTSFNAG